VGSQYFSLLGIKPVLGREFRAEEEFDSTLPPVVVLSHEFWSKRLGSDPEIAGKQLTLDSTSYTVAGVMPGGFRGLSDRAEAWFPPATLPGTQGNFRDRGTRGLNVVGRLRDGVGIDEARAEMDNISLALERSYPGTNEKRGVEVVPLTLETFGNVTRAVVVLFGAVSLVMFISLANVANLMLLRTETRQSEIALRAAVGASRSELLRLIFTETFFLSFVGAALGVLVSGWAVDLVLALSPIQLPSFVNVALDGNVIAFAIGLTFLTGLLMAVAPAVQLRPSGIHEALSSTSTRSTGVRSMRRVRNALVIGEIGLSFVLLLSAGLLIESFRQLLNVDTGYDASNLLTMRVGFDGDAPAKTRLLRESVASLPGVKSVAITSTIPFSGGPAAFYSAEGEPPPSDATTAPRAYFHFITPHFFRTMGIPFRYGRDFNETEADTSVIVSENLAERFWPGQDPVGKRIRISRNNPDNPWLNIVGVVGVTKTRGIPDNPTPDPDIYFTYERFGGAPGLLIRSEIEPSSLTSAVVGEIKRLDKLAVVSSVATMEALIRPRTARSRFLSILSGVFSGLALALALVGIYGSISYTVAQRTREIGIRIALGADRRGVLRMVLGRSLVLIGSGLGLGLIGSLFASHGISALLFGIRATAPSVFIVTSLLMIVTGLGAAYIPARSASRIDPLSALRQE
jgi:putative ABC transport system permease protein